MTDSEDNPSIRVLWLRPTKPDNISVGRERIAEHLRKCGYHIDIQDASGVDAFRAVLTAVRGQYDIIVGTVRMGLYVGILASRLTCRPFIGDVTDPIEQINYLPSPLYWLLFNFEHLALKNADESMFVYNSSYEKAKQRGIDGVKVQNAVDYQQFDNPNQIVIETARTELATAGVDSRPIAIYIGGLSPVYHIKSILEVAQKLDTVQFVFIGDGELKQAVSRSATTTKNVFYLGTYKHELIPGFLAAADIGLCLVDAEQPLKVLEYGAAGLPVIAIHGELRQRFTDEELLFVDPDTELDEAIRELAADSDLAKYYGTNLNHRAANTNWSHVATQYKDAINEAIHE